MYKNIYLTFDMDWAIDPVLDDFYNLIEEYDLKGEINVTHYTDRIQKWGNERLEYGIHPNFNFSLLGQCSKGAEDIIKDLKQMFPDAVTFRSHSLMQSSALQNMVSKFDIKYELNTYIPAMDGMVIYPFKSVDGEHMILPFIFEDDIYLNQGMKHEPSYYLSDKFEAPRIFNFHPIHLFLNTDCSMTYEKSRDCFNDIKLLKKCRNRDRYGARDFFLELVEDAKKESWQFEKICEGEWVEGNLG